MEAARHREEAGYSTGSGGTVCVMLIQIQHSEASRDSIVLIHVHVELHYEPLEDTRLVY